MPRAVREDEPLLPCGLHKMTLSELRVLCVDAPQFGISLTRAKIMDGLRAVLERLVASWVVGEVWVDGSFLTHRIDPEDSDIVVRIGGGIYEEGLPEQKIALNWIIGNLREEYFCDCYILFEYWEGHPLYAEGDMNNAWYKARYGFRDGGDEGEFKGIAVVRLPEGVR